SSRESDEGTVQSDPTDVWAVTHALGQSVREAYSKLNRQEAFHRLALPYFEDAGNEAAARHMGQVVTEMLAADLAKTAPFVVLDRHHLDQVMAQNHLVDMYRVDPPSAVAF